MQVQNTLANEIALPKKIHFRDLGLVDFQSAWNLQNLIRDQIINEKVPGMVLLCEHFPVITMGKRSKDEDLFYNAKEMEKMGVQFANVDRGGELTYHGPGQIVIYPIVDLKVYGADLVKYVRKLEKIIIQTLNQFCSLNSLPDLSLGTIEKHTGVWARLGDAGHPTKIASIGIHVKKWVTTHGLAINIFDQSKGFNLINPCGLTNSQLSSVEGEIKFQLEKHGELGRIDGIGKILDLGHIKEIFRDQFLSEFVKG